MDRDEICKMVHKKRVEDGLRQGFELSLPDRVARYLEIEPHAILPYHHFSPVSAECVDLYRNAHFYGCISLVQAVAEALVKFLCERNGWKPDRKYEKNIKRLSRRGFLSTDLHAWLLDIWERRDDYHHLNPDIEQDMEALQELARHKLEMLCQAEKVVFDFEIKDGCIVPKNPKYWEIRADRTMPVYYNFE